MVIIIVGLIKLIFNYFCSLICKGCFVGVNLIKVILDMVRVLFLMKVIVLGFRLGCNFGLDGKSVVWIVLIVFV